CATRVLLFAAPIRRSSKWHALPSPTSIEREKRLAKPQNTQEAHQSKKAIRPKFCNEEKEPSHACNHHRNCYSHRDLPRNRAASSSECTGLHLVRNQADSQVEYSSRPGSAR